MTNTTNQVYKTTIMSIKAYVTHKSKELLTLYIEENKMEEEKREYYMSDDYGIHLHYLIETWVSTIKNVFLDINCDEIFDDGFGLLENGLLQFFDEEWLDDIFERHILVTSAVCLK